MTFYEKSKKDDYTHLCSPLFNLTLTLQVSIQRIEPMRRRLLLQEKRQLVAELFIFLLLWERTKSFIYILEIESIKEKNH